MHRINIIYLLTMSMTVALLCAIVFTVNYLVDPLWVSGGNKLSNLNFIYNERYSKTAIYLNNPEEYDCIIFGSSTATLLNPNKIDGHNCFNFSFSQGNIREYVKYAELVRERSPRLRYVIVAVDGFNLVDSELANRPMADLKSLMDGRSSLSVYLSLETFVFALRTLFHLSPLQRYYRSDFTVDVLDDTRPYEHHSKMTRNFVRLWNQDPDSQFSCRNCRFLKQLQDQFPDVDVVGYVPPVSADLLAYLYLSGTLEGYLRSTYEVSRMFSRFYDYSVPSDVTIDPANTYDGQHFMPSIHDEIAKAFGGGPIEFGIFLHDTSWSEYSEEFTNKAKDYVRKFEIQIVENFQD